MSNDRLQLLRQKAEHILTENTSNGKLGQHTEVNQLFHELQIYQLELEMQVEELRNITAELEAQKKKFQHLFNAAPIGYLVVSKHGIIQDMNKMAAEMLGQNRQMLVAKPLSTFIHPEDVDRFYIFLRYLLAVHQQQQCTMRLRSGKTGYKDVQLSAISLDIDDSQHYSYITLTDVTESQQAQLKLQEANHRLELALNASGTGIWEVEVRTGRIILDESSQSLLGLRSFGFKGDLGSLLDLIHPDDRQAFAEELRKAITSESAFNHFFRICPSSGRAIYFHASGRRAHTGDQRFIGTFTDVTEKIRLREEANLLKEKQQQAVTAAAIEGEEKEKARISEALHNGVGQLLYGMKLGLESIKYKSPDEYLQLSGLLSQAIRDTRNISHELTPTTLVTFGLRAALEEMADRFADQVSFDLAVLNMPPKPDQHLALSIYRIIQELVNNSVRHGHAGYITIKVERLKKMIRIQVTDNGTGFDAGSKKTGNGLAGIKNRLLVYDGSLSIESGPQKGTKIEVKLKHFPV